jgi:plastocyanin
MMKGRAITTGIGAAIVTMVTVFGVIGASGCKKEEPPPPAAPPPAAPAAAAADGAARPAGVPEAARGSSVIKGSVKLDGKRPEVKMIKRDTDPFCARKQMPEEEIIVSKDGLLKNVLVRISKGMTGNYDPPMTNATLDQSECMYRPRVQGIMAGQSLLIRNSDQTLHNVHSYKGASTIFNQAQVPGLPPMAKKFSEVGDIIKFKCDVHPWMTGYVAIMNHPFFAITGDDGTFTIPKVPAGKYTLEAWHERLGVKTAEINVTTDKPTETAFSFTAP